MAGLADFAPEQTSHEDTLKITTNRVLISTFPGANGFERTGVGEKLVPRIKPPTIFQIAGLTEASSFRGCDSETTVGHYSTWPMPLFLPAVRRGHQVIPTTQSLDLGSGLLRMFSSAHQLSGGKHRSKYAEVPEKHARRRTSE